MGLTTFVGAMWFLGGRFGPLTARLWAHGAGPVSVASGTDAGVLQFRGDAGSGGSGYGVGRRERRPSVSVVVPALNEEECIDWVVDNIPSWVSEIVLVDGLSVDGTELVVTDRREDVVIVHQRARGKGAALRAGFAAASGDIVVMIDADGSTDPREMGRFVDALVQGADFVKGSRNLTGGGSADFTVLRHLGNLGFVLAANLLFGSRFTDLCYGYCAFWRRDLGALALTADGFEIEMELILSAVRVGMDIAEVPSLELERRAGTSNLNAWTDGKRVLKTLLKERVRTLERTRAASAQIHLAPVQLPAHGTEHWLPAGSDRRRHLAGDRRVSRQARAGYTGSERRVCERRTRPLRTSEVLIAHSGNEAVIGTGVAPRRKFAQR
jgi:glycosyltransferase involved in cell wall biosynthesis